MATQPNNAAALARLRQQYGNGNVINPLDNPYFGTSEGRGQRGDGRQRFGSGFSMGNADGSGFYDFSGIPGAEAFVPQDDGRGNGQGIDPQALATWLQQKGYVMRQGDDPQTNTSMRWIEDAQGNIVGQPQQFDNTDQQFSNAIKAATLITGANVVTALPGLQAAQAAAAGAGGAGAGGTATLGATGAMATPVATSAALPTLGAATVPTAASLGVGELATLGAATAGGAAGGGLTAGGAAGGTATGVGSTGLGATGGATTGTTLGTAGSGLSTTGTVAGGTATGVGSTGLTAAGGAGTGTTLGVAGSGLTTGGTAAGQVATGLGTTGLGAVDPSAVGGTNPTRDQLTGRTPAPAPAPATDNSWWDRIRTGAATANDWLQLGAAILPAIGGAASRPDAVDTSGVRGAAEANRRIGTDLEGLARGQFDQLTALFREFEPVLRQQIGTALADQDLSRGRSNEEWQDYVQTYRPVGQRLAQMSLDMANPARKEQEAARAASDTTTQFDRARMESRRALEQAGASQDKIASLEAAGRLSEAKAVGGVQGTARRDTESRAMQYLSGAANFGQNIQRNSMNLSQLADQQGNRAVNLGNTTLEAATLPGTAAARIGQAAVGANNASGSLFSAANRDQAASDLARNNSVLGGLAGTARLIGQLVED
jgi:hypothetical protein